MLQPGISCLKQVWKLNSSWHKGMIRAICFDFDGTLARFRGDLNKLSIAMFAKLGLKDFSPINLEHVRKVFRSFEYAPEVVTLESATRKTFAALGITPKGNVLEICQQFIADYAAGVQLLPNALETLHYFLHLPKAIITNVQAMCNVQQFTPLTSSLTFKPLWFLAMRMCVLPNQTHVFFRLPANGLALRHTKR